MEAAVFITGEARRVVMELTCVVTVLSTTKLPPHLSVEHLVVGFNCGDVMVCINGGWDTNRSDCHV